MSAVLGIDQSAAGTAMVALDYSGLSIAARFYADTKKAATQFRADGALIPVTQKKGETKEQFKVRRLLQLRLALLRFLCDVRPTHAALEDYAMTKQAITARVLGEVGGLVRLELYRASYPYRVYDIGDVKSFATGRGNAEKAEMVLACRDKWEGRNFLPFGKVDGAAGNLADAYVIAQMIRAEVLVRDGNLNLSDLAPEEAAVLRKTTKNRDACYLEIPFA